MAELSEKARECKRHRKQRYRERKRAEAQAESEAWLHRQLGPDHDWQPTEWDWTLVSHRAWCRELLAMPRMSDLTDLPGREL
jgi:hypothetical protein